MAIFPMLSVIDILYGMTFIALSRIWTYLVIMVIATVVNLGASLILIRGWPTAGLRSRP